MEHGRDAEYDSNIIHFLIPQYLPLTYLSLSLKDQEIALSIEEAALDYRKLFGRHRIGDVALEQALKHMREILDVKIGVAHSPIFVSPKW